jgi:hypothetical protein
MYTFPDIIKTKKRNETEWICSTHEIDDKIVRYLEYVKANSYYKLLDLYEILLCLNVGYRCW